MSAAIAGPASAINAAVANRNFRIIPPPRGEGAVCNAGGSAAVADQPPQCRFAKRPLALGARPVHSTAFRGAALAARIFLLTRVTRIFQKSVFTETTPRRPGGTPRRAFCCADTERPRAAYFFGCRTRRQVMQFQKGESGNPAGRPRGSLNRTTVLMQSLLEANAEAIARKAIDLATGGDLTAIRICFDRLVPAPKHEPIAREVPRVHRAADTRTDPATIRAGV